MKVAYLFKELLFALPQSLLAFSHWFIVVVVVIVVVVDVIIDIAFAQLIAVQLLAELGREEF